MHIVYPDVGLVRILRMVANGGLTYAVFSNDVFPASDSELNFFDLDEFDTVEVSESDFDTEGITSGTGFIRAPIINVAPLGGVSREAYGYVITDSVSGELIACARFNDSPRTIAPTETCPVVPILFNFSQLQS